MIVKICGIKTLPEALAALDAGAVMLGFNFYPPSPRSIDRETCAQIVSALHSMHKKLITVGVFVNEEPDRVRETLKACSLDLAQLSGDEGPETLSALDGYAYKAIRPASQPEAEALLHAFARKSAPALLVDASVRGAYGGTGQTSNWLIAQSLSARTPLLLAGGLTPQNVGEAIRLVRPWGVDVASGVESSPGVKDPAKIRAFVDAVRSAERFLPQSAQ